VDGGDQIPCENCDRRMLHDWTTVSVVQNIIKRRMREAHQAKAGAAGGDRIVLLGDEFEAFW
jgi:hypothetical protein